MRDTIFIDISETTLTLRQIVEKIECLRRENLSLVFRLDGDHGMIIGSEE